MFSLNGKTALVTGASGGIGYAIAKSLHEQGATVVLSGTRLEALERLQKELGSRAYVQTCNLSDPNSLAELFEKAEEQAGPVDVLVNNAGITRDNLAMRLKDEDWQTVLDVNLTAAFKLSRAAAKAMMKRKAGRIINITSVVGVTGNAGQTNYSAAKAGMIGMSKSMAQELAGRGVTINCIAPGFIKTAMTDKVSDKAHEGILKSIPMARMGAPEEIASAAVYLASDESGYITGQTMHINGGMAMI